MMTALMRAWGARATTATVLLLLLSSSGNSAVFFDLPVDPTLIYKFVLGSEFHSLDYRRPLGFTWGSGGGAYATGFYGDPPDYAEAGVDLPQNAMISEVTFIYRNCTVFNDPRPFYYMGAYTPDVGTFTYYIPETVGQMRCGSTFVDPVTLGSPVIVDNSQNRYVAGVKFGVASVAQTFVGVRIGYSTP